MTTINSTNARSQLVNNTQMNVAAAKPSNKLAIPHDKVDTTGQQVLQSAMGGKRQVHDDLRSDAGSTPAQDDSAIAEELGGLTQTGDYDALERTFAAHLHSAISRNPCYDVNLLIQQVLAESYMLGKVELEARAEKIRAFNEAKKLIRDEMEQANQHLAAQKAHATDEPYYGKTFEFSRDEQGMFVDVGAYVTEELGETDTADGAGADTSGDVGATDGTGDVIDENGDEPIELLAVQAGFASTPDRAPPAAVAIQAAAIALENQLSQELAAVKGSAQEPTAGNGGSITLNVTTTNGHVEEITVRLPAREAGESLSQYAGRIAKQAASMAKKLKTTSASDKTVMVKFEVSFTGVPAKDTGAGSGTPSEKLENAAMTNGAGLGDKQPTALKDGTLEAYAKGLEQQLNTIGDDSQLANIDLQSVMQTQQSTLQALSNISKMLHDTAMAIIRKIG